MVECAWASLKYNPWAKGIYDRICGKQKTRKKKAAVALARKIAVLAWAMLRDEKDWDPKTMIDITETYGRMNPSLKESLQSMKPKENSDQRKSRLRREAKKAKEAEANTVAKPTTKAKASRKAKKAVRSPQAKAKPSSLKPKPTSEKTITKTTTKPRRARKPVSAV